MSVIDEKAIEDARRIALRLARRCPPWVDRDDLISAAWLGLVETAARYRPREGYPFMALACHRIRGAVFDEMRRSDTLSKRARRALRITDAVTTRSRTIDVTESRPASPEAVAADREQIGHALEALKRLTSRDRLVIAMTSLDLTGYEIGKALGVTNSRISQLHTRAMSRLRVELGVEQETACPA